MKIIIKEELQVILDKHAAWLRGDTQGERANLDGVNLDGASLVRANLDGANLDGASLNYASLVDASLNGASLDGASLNRASLVRASLDGASLNYASLVDASLNGASLDGASLVDASLNRASLVDASLNRASLVRANLDGANLDGASLNYASLPHFLITPETGEFRAYKALSGRCIAELTVPSDADRTNSLVGRKCRASKVIVTRIYTLDGVDQHKGKGLHDGTKYVVGETVRPFAYNGDIRIECTQGIHFFMTKREAVEYAQENG